MMTSPVVNGDISKLCFLVARCQTGTQKVNNIIKSLLNTIKRTSSIMERRHELIAKHAGEGDLSGRAV